MACAGSARDREARAVSCRGRHRARHIRQCMAPTRQTVLFDAALSPRVPFPSMHLNSSMVVLGIAASAVTTGASTGKSRRVHSRSNRAAVGSWRIRRGSRGTSPCVLPNFAERSSGRQEGSPKAEVRRRNSRDWVRRTPAVRGKRCAATDPAFLLIQRGPYALFRILYVCIFRLSVFLCSPVIFAALHTL